MNADGTSSSQPRTTNGGKLMHTCMRQHAPTSREDSGVDRGLRCPAIVARKKQDYAAKVTGIFEFCWFISMLASRRYAGLGC